MYVVPVKQVSLFSIRSAYSFKMLRLRLLVVSAYCCWGVLIARFE